MKCKSITSILLIFLVASFFIGMVNARGEAFVIEPSKEVIEKVELKVPDEVVGNVTVSNGSIDFYITNPSGTILFYSNETAFESFKFTAKQNGTYIMHLLNPTQENVTATLNYGINFFIILQETITMTSSLGTAVVTTITTITPTFFDWVELLKNILISIPGFGALAGFIKWGIKAIKKFWEKRKWNKKYGKSRTPVVIKRFLAIILSYF